MTQRDRGGAGDIVVNGTVARRVDVRDLPQEIQDEVQDDLRRIDAGLPPSGKSLTDFTRPDTSQL